MEDSSKKAFESRFDGRVLDNPWLKNIRCNRLGQVKNIKTDKILKPWKMKKGHTQVSVSLNGLVKKFLTHRIVAMCFIPNTENKPCVNHINGKPWDNRVENLEWCTDRENKDHAKKMGLFESSTRRYNAAFNEFQILTIHTLKWPQSKMAKHYSVSQGQVSRIKTFKNYSNFAVIK